MNENIIKKVEELKSKYNEKSILNYSIDSLMMENDPDYEKHFSELTEDMNKEIRYLRLNIVKQCTELYLYLKTIDDIESLNKSEECVKVKKDNDYNSVETLEEIEDEMQNLIDHIDEISDQLYTKIISLGIINDIKYEYIEKVFNTNKEEKNNG